MYLSTKYSCPASGGLTTGPLGPGPQAPELQGRDLARNEEFSEIAVINIFFTVLKKKPQLSVGGGGPAGKISR